MKNTLFEFVRYAMTSGVALAIDLSTFFFLLRVLDVNPYAAAAIGFLSGLVIAYLLSTKWVFNYRRMAQQSGKEFSVFVGIGLGGLLITQGVLWVGIEKLSLSAEASKIAAVGISFAFNYIMRKVILFSRLFSRAQPHY